MEYKSANSSAALLLESNFLAKNSVINEDFVDNSFGELDSRAISRRGVTWVRPNKDNGTLQRFSQ